MEFAGRDAGQNPKARTPRGRFWYGCAIAAWAGVGMAVAASLAFPEPWIIRQEAACGFALLVFAGICHLALGLFAMAELQREMEGNAWHTEADQELLDTPQPPPMMFVLRATPNTPNAAKASVSVQERRRVG